MGRSVRLSAASVTRSSSAASLAFFHPLGGLTIRGSIRTASLRDEYTRSQLT